MHNDEQQLVLFRAHSIVGDSLLRRTETKSFAVSFPECVFVTRKHSVILLPFTTCLHLGSRRIKLLMLTCITTKQGIPLQQFQANKGRQDSRDTKAHVGIGVRPRLLLLPQLQPALDCWQAAVLFTRICKNAGRRLQSLSTLALVVRDLRITFVCCGVPPALLCCTLNRRDLASVTQKVRLRLITALCISQYGRFSAV